MKDLNFNVHYSSFTKITDKDGKISRQYLFNSKPLSFVPYSPDQEYNQSYSVLMSPSIFFTLVNSDNPDSEIRTNINSFVDKEFLDEPRIIKNTSTITSSMDIFNHLSELKRTNLIKLRFNRLESTIEIYKANADVGTLHEYFPKVSDDYNIFNPTYIYFRRSFDSGIISKPYKLNDFSKIDLDVNNIFN
jgi:hypothetical protein